MSGFTGPDTDTELTAADVVEVELPTALRGYRTEDVDALLDRVADALEAREALLASMTQDRDQLVVELRSAEAERDRARAGAADAESAARAAVDDARRLRERVQGRAETLLADAARRADELRQGGRRDAAELVADAEVRARTVVAEAEQRRDELHHEVERRWQALQHHLDETTRVSERARERVREELLRQLEVVDRWDEVVEQADAEDRAVVEAAAQAIADDAQAVEEARVAEEVRVAEEGDATGTAPEEDGEHLDSSEDPAPVVEAPRSTLAALTGIDDDELALLEAPWDLTSSEDAGRVAPLGHEDDGPSADRTSEG